MGGVDAMDPGLLSLDVTKSVYPSAAAMVAASSTSGTGMGASSATSLHLQDKAGLTEAEELAEEQAEADAVRIR